ncbi:MAG: hypothetical protein M3468_08705 [Acidobacteriota bacterium]|nr:hypothetical protein [Acidobacteriota bacterium]
MRRVRFIPLTFTVAAALHPFQVEAAQQPSAPSASLTCDASTIKSDSYRLTTEAQALNALRPREPWWEPFGIWKVPGEIGSVNEGATTLAERARELDDSNLLAHGQIAREYLVRGIDARKAEDAWRRVLDGGGAVVWTATLYEVDPRSLFVVAFDRKSLRIFRLGAVAGELDTHFGVPEVPRPEQVNFWRALGGCLPANAVPEAEISWSDVSEISANNWMLRFDLERKVAVKSDRGRNRTDDSLEITLHGHAGPMDFRFAMSPYRPGPFGPRPVGPDPALFQERVRQTVIKFVDPEGRIELPKLHRSWSD